MEAYEALLTTLDDLKPEHEAILTEMADFLRIFELAGSDLAEYSQVGDLVLIKKDNISSLQWQRGRILRLYPEWDDTIAGRAPGPWDGLQKDEFPHKLIIPQAVRAMTRCNPRLSDAAMLSLHLPFV
ncbi:hypothetical protein EVAR_57048_1 [Eumeta japonica]|uniref:DUF5641 domain-containing protein n=1 Tax=Eumeta variegata TaxID=151549 RepID=A0A4C1YRS1_EUMVA|nr:hypothetical protein EVAR_57048_1 [Eumeta japonica]